MLPPCRQACCRNVLLRLWLHSPCIRTVRPRGAQSAACVRRAVLCARCERAVRLCAAGRAAKLCSQNVR
eukprot:1897765-Pleurochrysis_carterae.AAC.1